MKIIKLLYFKYALAFSICLISSFVIFFIFSLIGNLNEDYFFSTIINLSLINSFQILLYVPSFIFLLSIILLSIFLKSKNEIIIIKSFLSTNKLMLFFLPIIITFTLIEINKKEIGEILEESKTVLTKNINQPPSKIVISKNKNSKIISVFKNLKINSLDDAEYRIYKIVDAKINLAEFSNNLIVLNNTLIAENYTKYSNSIIKDFDTQKKININLTDLINQKTIVREISDENHIEINLNFLNILVFFIIFFNYIFLVFFNKNYIGTKQSLFFPILTCLLILIYSFLIFNTSLNFYKNEFEILASLVVAMFFLKVYLNE